MMTSQTSALDIINNLPIAVVEIDATFKIRQLNVLAKQVFPFNASDHFAIETLNPKLESSTISLKDRIQTAMRRKQPVHDLIVSLSSSQSETTDWFQMNAEPLFHSDGLTMVLSFVNINRRKEQEKQLAEQQAQLSEAARHIGVNILAGGLAHEINNPLAILRGYTDIVRSKVAKGIVKPEELEKDLFWIEKNVVRISNIINMLKQFAQESSNPEFESRDLKSIVEGALIFCRERMVKHNICLAIDDIPDSIAVECNWAEIAQAVYNILLNSFDALIECNEPEKWISISHRERKQYVEIIITDNGPGIPEDVAEQMLLPFYTTKSPGNGMGLGLTVAHDYLVSHNGYLKYNGDSPHTMFTIGLPKQRAAKSA